MKSIGRSLAMVYCVVTLGTVALAQTSYVWQGADGDSWATSTSWNPSRTTPASNDVLVFSTGATLSVTGVVTQTVGRITVSNGTNITLQSSATATLTIGNQTGDDLVIASGSSLTIGGSNTLTVTLAASSTADISGTLAVNTSRTFNTNGTSVVTTVSGILSNAGTVTSTTASKLVVSNGGKYTHNQNGGTYPTATWNTGSTCEVTGTTLTSPGSSINQSYYNFTWNCASQSSAIGFGGNLTTVNGTLTISNSNSSEVRFVSTQSPTITIGTLSISGSNSKLGLSSGTGAPNVTVSGDVTISSGTLNSGTSGAAVLSVGGNWSNTGTFTAGTGLVSFNGTGAQSITNASGETFNGLTVNKSSGSLTLNNSVTVSGALTMTNGAITLNGNTLSYGASGTLAYSGTSSQTTSDAEFPSSSGPANLTLNNSAGVSLHATRTITGMLTLGGNNSYTDLSNVSGYSGITYAATVPQTTGGELGSSITNLKINNASGVTLGGSTSVTGTLTFTSGNIALNGYSLTLGVNPAGTGTMSWASGLLTGSGSFTRWYGTSAISGVSGYFPMGTGSDERSLAITGTPTNGGTVTVQYADASGTTGLSFNENSTDFDKRTNSSWTVTTGNSFATGNGVTMKIKANALPGVTALADLNLSGATGAAVGSFSATTGTVGVPEVNRSFDASTPLDGTYYIAATSNSPLPVQMVSLMATANRLSAELHWSTATETNNFGFDIERKTVASDWAKVGFVEGAGTSTSLHNYEYTDAVGEAGTYQYRIKQIDKNGAFKYSSVMQVEVGAVAKVLSLGSNYPNPFNPATSIEFSVPSDGRAVLKVYNMLGQEVATLFDGIATAGKLMKATFNASRLSSGVYFSRLDAGGNALVKRMMLVK